MNESTAKNQALRQITTVLSSPPMFDHEKLDVYQLELLFIAWVTPLLEEVAAVHGRTREVCDQLDRDARGSATECAGCLDALVAKRAVTEERILDGKRILVRIVSILCALVDRFDNPGQLKDEPLMNTFDILPEPQRVRYSTKISRTRTTTRRNSE
jgi:hypothetical protein